MEVGLVWNVNWKVRASMHESANCLQFTSTATGAENGDMTLMLPGYYEVRLPTLRITQKRSEMAPDGHTNGSSQVQSMTSRNIELHGIVSPSAIRHQTSKAPCRSTAHKQVGFLLGPISRSRHIPFITLVPPS